MDVAGAQEDRPWPQARARDREEDRQSKAQAGQARGKEIRGEAGSGQRQEDKASSESPEGLGLRGLQRGECDLM
jgi:hypothetical protein